MTITLQKHKLATISCGYFPFKFQLPWWSRPGILDDNAQNREIFASFCSAPSHKTIFLCLAMTEPITRKFLADLKGLYMPIILFLIISDSIFWYFKCELGLPGKVQGKNYLQVQCQSAGMNGTLWLDGFAILNQEVWLLRQNLEKGKLSTGPRKMKTLTWDKSDPLSRKSWGGGCGQEEWPLTGSW